LVPTCIFCYMSLTLIRIRQIKVPLEFEVFEVSALSALVSKILRQPVPAEWGLKLVHRSVDARAAHKPPEFVLAVELSVPEKLLPIAIKAGAEVREPVPPTVFPKINLPASKPRPVVVGAGPSGLMAALVLAEAGLNPILIERGAPVEERKLQVRSFWQQGELDEESNTLYGEGGAGLYSDGKLTSRSKDSRRLRRFLQALVEAGAPDDILIDAEPHLGSDQLSIIVPRIRARLLQLGAEVRFFHRLEKIESKGGQLSAIWVNSERIECEQLVLGTGHSARDVFKLLTDTPALLEPKPFAIGVRLELPQSVINRAQYKSHANHPKLGTASFRLTRKEEPGSRACYSFCMCPGGLVIACASTKGKLTSNGMSLSKRDLDFGNAAFLAPVRPEDIPKTNDGEPAILDGYKFQEAIERKAFELGGGDYGLPASRLRDFVSGKASRKLPEERSCGRAVPANLHHILPESIAITLVKTLPKMVPQLRGSSIDQALLYGAETRSSSPIRITRGESGQSIGLLGLFPTGEGAGYAGGIVSAGIDGIKAAEAMIAVYQAQGLTSDT